MYKHKNSYLVSAAAGNISLFLFVSPPRVFFPRLKLQMEVVT